MCTELGGELMRRRMMMETMEGEMEMWNTIFDDVVVTDDDGITGYLADGIRLEDYSDIYIFVDRTFDSRNTLGTDLKINVIALGFMLTTNLNFANPKDSYRDLCLHVVNLKNDNIIVDASVSNNHINNPANIQLTHTGQFLSAPNDNYRNKLKLIFNQRYIGTFRIRVVAK